MLLEKSCCLTEAFCLKGTEKRFPHPHSKQTSSPLCLPGFTCLAIKCLQNSHFYKSTGWAYWFQYKSVLFNVTYLFICLWSAAPRTHLYESSQFPYLLLHPQKAILPFALWNNWRWPILPFSNCLTNRSITRQVFQCCLWVSPTEYISGSLPLAHSSVFPFSFSLVIQAKYFENILGSSFSINANI